MGKGKKIQKEQIGGFNYVNKNCWLVKTLNYPSSERCRYCELRFRNCLFFQYLIISLALVSLLLALFFFIEGEISKISVVSIFILVIIYGYFFSRSTEKIIRANFAQRKAKEALKELAESLEDQVDRQTKDIQKKNQYLQELLNIKSDFLRVVNHQLNTPLSVIRNAYSMLQEKSIDPAKGFEYLGAGVKRMADTIKDFWDAYELEGKKMEVQTRETDIAEIVDSQVKEKQQLPQAKEKNLKITIANPDFNVPKVFCDGKKITHVISNLLDNAIYYTPHGAVTVAYDIAADKKFLQIAVADTGIGIAPSDQLNLFKKFSRGSSSVNVRPDGSGLGLYIAKKIIESNGGELKLARTEVGKGTTFSLAIPLYTGQKEINFAAKDELTAAAKKPNNNPQTMANNQKAAESGTTAKNPKILMVEDEKSLVDMYHKYLMDKGFDFYTTPVIDEALAVVKTVPIDVVLLDIIIPKKMPDGSIYTMAEQGWDFLKLIKEDDKTKNIPIIVWTNLDNPDAKKKAKELGAAKFVVKSQVMAPELMKVMEDALASRKKNMKR